LVTGKYLNVIRECGLSVHNADAKPFVYTSNDRDYTEKIEKAYTFASKKLLDLLIQDKKLIERLKSIKHYFLLDQGDFFVHFMDTAGAELRKPVQGIQILIVILTL
jgi:gamma-tubulin complex component 2